MTTDSSQNPTVQIALRLAPDLRDRIKAAAQSNNRSVNSELIAVLEEKYPSPRLPNIGVRGLRLLATMSTQQRDDFIEEMTSYWHQMAPVDQVPILVEEVNALRAVLEMLEARVDRQLSEQEILRLLDLWENRNFNLTFQDIEYVISSEHSPTSQPPRRSLQGASDKQLSPPPPKTKRRSVKKT